MTPFRTEVEQAERRVLEAAVVWRASNMRPPETQAERKLDEHVATLLALRAATCPTCGGTGEVPFLQIGGQWCPACRGKGAKP